MKIEPITLEQCLDLRQKVLWPDRPREALQLAEDNAETARHYGLFVQDKLISCLSLFMTNNDNWVIRKFATLEAYQSRGYGTQLLQQTLSIADNAGIKKVSLDSRRSAVRFYQKSGFQICSEIFIKDGIEFVKMQRYTDLSLQ